jgi:hypothetical protein
MVVARANAIEQRALHVDTEGLPGSFGDLKRELYIAAADIDIEFGFIDQNSPLDDVSRHLTVESKHFVACQ